MSSKAKQWLGLVIWFAVIAVGIFAAAGTLSYWQAWVYIAVGVVTSVPIVRHVTNDPALLENRSKFGPAAEARPIQKIIVLLVGVPAIATFVVPGFDHRFGWSSVPLSLCLGGDLLVLASMWMVYRVYKENSFGSATVEIGKDQRVITTGPYAIVRNPMYSSAAVYFIGVSLALGSYWGLVPAVLTILGFVWRLFDEEAFLAHNLPGYRAYCADVRWHLVPGVF